MKYNIRLMYSIVRDGKMKPTIPNKYLSEVMNFAQRTGGSKDACSLFPPTIRASNRHHCLKLVFWFWSILNPKCLMSNIEMSSKSLPHRSARENATLVIMQPGSTHLLRASNYSLFKMAHAIHENGIAKQWQKLTTCDHPCASSLRMGIKFDEKKVETEVSALRP